MYLQDTNGKIGPPMVSEKHGAKSKEVPHFTRAKVVPSSATYHLVFPDEAAACRSRVPCLRANLSVQGSTPWAEVDRMAFGPCCVRFIIATWSERDASGTGETRDHVCDCHRTVRQ